MLLLDVMVDRRYLRHVQLPRQHNHIGKLRIELQRLCVGYIQLRREMHLFAYLVRVLHNSYIAGDDSINAHCMSLVHDLAHQRQILRIHHCVNGQIGLHARLTTRSNDRGHIVRGEVDRTAGTHIQVLNTEIDTRSTGLYRRCQTLPAPYRCHYFYLWLIIGHFSVAIRLFVQH